VKELVDEASVKDVLESVPRDVESDGQGNYGERIDET